MSELATLAKSRLEELISFTGVNVEAEVVEDEEGIKLSIESTTATARLIGHHGETLRAIEYLVSQTVRHVDPDAPRVSVDVAGYREARREQLADRAREVAARVIASGREEEFKPMNPADRRIIHMTLQGMDGVSTESRGEARTRRIVVMPA
jgi:spoIIIJ-associated protein